jgi:hypothetical protein
MVGVAACALGLLVVAVRSRHDRSIVVGWRAIELAVRRRRGMALLLILVPVCVWMFLFVGLLVGAELALVMGGLFLPLWLVVAPLWPWLSRLWKWAATSPAADVLQADGRAPVVYLRSFAVDPTRASAGGSVEGLTQPARRSHEDHAQSPKSTATVGRGTRAKLPPPTVATSPKSPARAAAPTGWGVASTSEPKPVVAAVLDPAVAAGDPRVAGLTWSGPGVTPTGNPLEAGVTARQASGGSPRRWTACRRARRCGRCSPSSARAMGRSHGTAPANHPPRTP